MTDQLPTTTDSTAEKKRTQLDYFADFVKGYEDETRLITVFMDFRMNQHERRKKESQVMPFGKYKYRSIKDVFEFDKKYLSWLVKQTSLDGYPEIKHNITTLLG